MRSYTAVLSGFLVLAFLGACVDSSRLDDSLVNAIRDTGFLCAEVTSSYDLVGDGSQWRVVCEDARAYLASVEQDGQICVSPFAYVDVPVFEIALEFQWPLQDVDVLRCTSDSGAAG